MATITFSAGGLTPHAFTLSASDVSRVLTALKTIFGQVPDGLGGFRDRTDQEVFDAWATSTMLALRDAVKRVEGDAATISALAALVDIAYA